jgi:hypothetical protein
MMLFSFLFFIFLLHRPVYSTWCICILLNNYIINGELGGQKIYVLTHLFLCTICPRYVMSHTKMDTTVAPVSHISIFNLATVQ